MDLVGHPGSEMCDSLEHRNPSKPAVDQVHGIKGDTRELDHGVVAASQEEEGNHVDGSHDAGTIANFLAKWSEGLVEIDAPDDKTDVGGEIANEQESLQTARKRTNVDGSRQLELAVVSGSEERRIQKVLPEGGEQNMRLREVPLGLVVEACYGADVADEVEDELVEKEDAHEGDPDVAEEVFDIDILEVCGTGALRMSTTTTSSCTTSRTSTTPVTSSTTSSTSTTIRSFQQASQDVGGGREGHCCRCCSSK